MMRAIQFTGRGFILNEPRTRQLRGTKWNIPNEKAYTELKEVLQQRQSDIRQRIHPDVVFSYNFNYPQLTRKHRVKVFLIGMGSAFNLAGKPLALPPLPLNDAILVSRKGDKQSREELGVYYRDLGRYSPGARLLHRTRPPESQAQFLNRIINQLILQYPHPSPPKASGSPVTAD